MPKESQNYLKALWKHLYKADISFFSLVQYSQEPWYL